MLCSASAFLGIELHSGNFMKKIIARIRCQFSCMFKHYHIIASVTIPNMYNYTFECIIYPFAAYWRAWAARERAGESCPLCLFPCSRGPLQLPHIKFGNCGVPLTRKWSTYKIRLLTKLVHRRILTLCCLTGGRDSGAPLGFSRTPIKGV